MSDLEKMIRAVAEAGELTHLSVCPVAGKGPQGVIWAASYSPASKWGTGFGRDPDPVEALKKAMTDQRLKKIVNKIEKTLKEAGPKRRRKSVAEEIDDSDFLG